MKYTNAEKAPDVTKMKDQVDLFMTATAFSRQLSERDRDYKDSKQWTAAEAAKLQKRGQAAIVVNRIQPKVKGFLGLVILRETDPLALPRTKKHEKAAEAITDGLRYVSEDNDFQTTKLAVAEELFVEGYSGAFVDIKQDKKGEIDPKIKHLPWDRIYFDPYSRRNDFSDARFKGFFLWLGEDQIKEMFPDADMDALRAGTSQHADETFADKPQWIDSGKSRYRVAYHFYITDGVWKMCVFSCDYFLLEPVESGFLDDEGEPHCPIELVSAYIDRENNRYGEVRGFISQQDEINHRRSKFLHFLSQRQTAGRKGAIKDVPALKRELAKGDGHVEYNGEKGDFEILRTNDMSAGQFTLYQDAKAELDAVSYNAQLAGDRQSGDLSGVAIEKLQSAGLIELNPLFTALNGWEKRIYRQIWGRIKQFWTQEKWLRVTDDQGALRWVGFNSTITAQEFLEETINDESKPFLERKQAAAAYQFMTQNNDPRLNEPVGVRNDVADIDVDITLGQTGHTINTQKEQFNMLVQFASGGDVDITDLLELSQLRGKDKLIKKIEARRQAAANAQGNIDMIKAKHAEAKVGKTMADTQLVTQEAIQKQVENQLMIQNPESVTSVSV